MSLTDLFSVSAAVLVSLGGGAAIVFALSKWLGDVWAARILEDERSTRAREQELLVRRRAVYTKLALSMRVFLDSGTEPDADRKNGFLAAYDEATLWAAEEVVTVLATFIDMLVEQKANPGSISQPALRAAFVHCMTAMRKDCGFPHSEYQHRVFTF